MSPSHLAARAATTVRRYGFRPVLIARAVAHRLLERRRMRLLRADYAGRVAEPAARASLRPPEIDLPVAAALPVELRGAAERLRDEAEMVARQEVDYLGSGPVSLGPRIDWQRDFKSGYRWAPAFYQDVQVTRLDDASDAKVPWELSRGHQLLTLARAARLYEDERLAEALEAQLDSWLRDNPAGQGINWVTPMEAAIRAINWVWAIGTLEGWRALNPGLRERVARSLQAHGRHIAANLEGSPLLRGNHYLSDVVGLLVLGTFLRDDPESRRWTRTARRALEREVIRQTCPDGTGGEASLPYHGLVLELLLVAWWVGERSGRPLSARYRERVERMLEVSRAVRHPGGRSPIFGDQDSGRILPASFDRPPTHDNLLDLGAAILGGPRALDAPPHEEVAWALGIEAYRALAARPVDDRPPPDELPHGGLYVLRAPRAHLVARWGGVGQNGNGGHAHNDLSSYELSYGSPLVVDSGTYVYTADITARDAFRSSRAHNVLVVDGLDMHPIPAGEPFQLPAHARFEVEEWGGSQAEIVLVGSHDGYRRPGAPAICRRRVALHRRDGAVEVTDEVSGAGRRRLESLVHLAPGCEAEADGPGAVAVRGPASARISFAGADEVTIERGWVSSCYGVREPAPLLRAGVEADLPATLSYRIEPA